MLQARPGGPFSEAASGFLRGDPVDHKKSMPLQSGMLLQLAKGCKRPLKSQCHGFTEIQASSLGRSVKGSMQSSKEIRLEFDQ